MGFREIRMSRCNCVKVVPRDSLLAKGNFGDAVGNRNESWKTSREDISLKVTAWMGG
jgi:hypothetical protein